MQTQVAIIGAGPAGTLLAHRGDASGHHVLDVARVDPGPVDDRVETGREEILGMHPGECAHVLLAAPARCADGVDDPGFAHAGLLRCLPTGPRAVSWLVCGVLAGAGGFA